jgi:hypothetical protein
MVSNVRTQQGIRASKLLQLAVPEVKLLLDYESRQGLIKGVFYHMDWKEERSILRQEAFDTWASVTEEVNAKLKPED